MKLLQPADLKIDGSNAMPLYLQLANEIQRVIDEGQLRPGDALPSERTLMEALGISRGTTRKAIEQLIEDRSLVRNPGSGTYVAPHVRQSLVQLESFSEIAFASGGEAQSELVGYVRRAATEKEQQFLQLAESQKDIVELTRLRKISGTVVSVQRAILPAPLLNKINELNESLYRYLEEKGVPVLSATQKFSAVAADKHLAYYLNISERDPILLVTRIGYSHNNIPVEYTQTWCLNEYYDFKIELKTTGK
ncbi:GntR family transcriptional regulator [Cedecea sp. VD20]|uniref:GntR family transcriptional regulator n=1 Tax=Cedecea sp. VD20 TaxID=3081241 RepID=UPI003018E3C4